MRTGFLGGERIRRFRLKPVGNRPTVSGCRKAVTVALAIGLAVGCGPDPPERHRAQGPPAATPQALDPPPLTDLAPDLERLEPAVRDRLSAARAQLAEKRAKGADTDELARELGELGKLYHAHGLREAARISYLNARHLAPEDARWPYYLGRLHQDLGATAEARAFFEHAQQLDRRYLPTHLALASALMDEGRLGSAEDQLRRALDLDASHAPAWVALGKIAHARQDYEQAVAHFLRALELAPQATGIHYPLGMAYRELGQLEKARSHLERRGNVVAPTNDPLMAELQALRTGARLHQNRGNTAFLEGRYPEAVAAFRQAIAADPDDAKLRANLAAALSRLGKGQEARAEIEHALRLDPTSSLAHFGMGTLLARAGEDPRAIDHYRRALASDDGFSDAHYNLANALRRQGRIAEAEHHYDRAVTLDPSHAQARYGRAVTLMRLERWHDARQALEDGHAAFPEVAPIANALARFLAACPVDALRDGPRALSLAQPLLQAESSLANVEAMAMALAELGRFAEATEVQRAALDAARQMQRADLATRLQAHLTRYQRGEPSRSP